MRVAACGRLRERRERAAAGRRAHLSMQSPQAVARRLARRIDNFSGVFSALLGRAGRSLPGAEARITPFAEPSAGCDPSSPTSNLQPPIAATHRRSYQPATSQPPAASTTNHSRPPAVLSLFCNFLFRFSDILFFFVYICPRSAIAGRLTEQRKSGKFLRIGRAHVSAVTASRVVNGMGCGHLRRNGAGDMCLLIRRFSRASLFDK